MGGTQRLTQAIGKSKAMELVLTGNHMDAKTAEVAGNYLYLSIHLYILSSSIDLSSPYL